MKLYILEPSQKLKKGDNPWNPWYDKAFGFVIRAETEEKARKIAHENAGDENRGAFLEKEIAKTKSPWLDKKYSTCNELLADGESELIIRDFNAA